MARNELLENDILSHAFRCDLVIIIISAFSVGGGVEWNEFAIKGEIMKILNIYSLQESKTNLDF